MFIVGLILLIVGVLGLIAATVYVYLRHKKQKEENVAKNAAKFHTIPLVLVIVGLVLMLVHSCASNRRQLVAKADNGDQIANVSIEGDEAFPSNVSLSVKLKATSSEIGEVEEAFKDTLTSSQKLVAVYEVKLIQSINGEEREIQPSDIKADTVLNISMKVDASIPEGFTIAHVHNDKSISYYYSKGSQAYTLKDGMATIQTKRLSYFGFICPKENEEKTFVVDWKNYDGTILASETYPYGATPEYKGAEPTREKDAQYTYRFDGWTTDIVPVKRNTTYLAKYEYLINSYTIKFYDEDGETLLDTKIVNYGVVPVYKDGVEVPTKEATAKYTYTFANWSPALVAVTGDASYQATYNATINKYQIMWLHDDGTLDKTTMVEYDAMPSYGGIPTKDPTPTIVYSFAGWSPEVEICHGDATYQATFNASTRYYQITWKCDDGSTYKTENYEYEQTPSFGSTPTRAATAQYTYTFDHWQPAITSVSADATYTAIFTKTVNKYNVYWKNWDDSLLKTDNLEYGSTPAWTGANPTRPNDSGHSYEFTGWSPAIATVTGEATYTALYKATEIKWTVTFIPVDGEPTSAIKSQKVTGGSKASKPSNPTPKDTHFVFDHWYSDAACTTLFNFNTPITADTNIYAHFVPGFTYVDETSNYRITWPSKAEGLETVKVPSHYQGKPITKIGRASSSDGGSPAMPSSVISATLPSTLTVIDYFAFSQCEYLTSIIIPKSVTTIGYHAFYCCYSLSSLTFESGSNLTTLRESCFVSDPIESFVLPSKVAVVWDQVFASNSIDSITFTTPSSIAVTFYARVFYMCQNLTELKMPVNFVFDTSRGTVFYGNGMYFNNITYPSTKANWNSHITVPTTTWKSGSPYHVICTDGTIDL